eukprot:779955-Pyramimonas_sp.AAC.1
MGSQTAPPRGGRDPGEPTPPPLPGGEAAPLSDPEDESNDGGPGVIVVDDAPVAPGGRGHRRDSRPDIDPNQKLGLAH